MGAGLTVQSQARLEYDPSPFEAWKDFSWGRHDASFSERIIELDDQTTDGAGKALVRLSAEGKGKDADRPLRLNANISVLEPGGRAVTESLRIPYRPNDLYIGTKSDASGRLGRDEPAVFEIAAVNADGEPSKMGLNWKILEIDYHYDWYRENGDWRWRRSRSVRTVNEGGGSMS